MGTASSGRIIHSRPERECQTRRHFLLVTTIIVNPLELAYLNRHGSQHFPHGIGWPLMSTAVTRRLSLPQSGQTTLVFMNNQESYHV